MFSVIIPCYNGEKYIERCLNSFLKQADGSFEVIVINDGSTDGSEAIIQKLIDGKENFSLYSQENKGQSAARNLGVDLARGEYVTFADADDYVMDDYAAVLNKAIHDHPDADVIQFETRGHEYRACVWSKCIRKSVLMQYDVRSGLNCPLGQDMGFSQKLRLVTDKIVYLNTHIYHYEINPQSVSVNLEKRFLIYRSIDDLLAFAEKRTLTDAEMDNLKKVVYNHGILYPLLFLKQHKIQGEEYRKYKEKVFAKMDEYEEYMPTKNHILTMCRVYCLWLRETLASAVRGH